MNNKFNEKHVAALEVIDPEIVDFYKDWVRMRESDEFETAANLLAHLAREILCGLEDKVPEEVGKIYDHIIRCFHKFSHRHEGGKPPRSKERFNRVWPEFENLLGHLVQSSSDFDNSSSPCPYTALRDSLVQLETELSEPSVTEWLIPSIDLHSHQSEIDQNLKRIAPLLAAFYRDWIRMRRSADFKCRSYLLAHLAREIDSGLRGALSTKQGKEKMQKQLGKENLGGLKDDIGHIASIMDALGIDSFVSRVDEWIQTVKNLADLTHRDIDDEAKLLRKEVESLWPRVESLWGDLVGGYLNLLDRVDRILKYEDEPSTDDQIKEALLNLLEFDTINKYFFQNLKSAAWLELLKEDGCFNPENNPAPQEDPDHPGYYRIPVWYALKYVGKVADYTKEHPCEKKVNILVDIVNTIVDNHKNDAERIDNYRTDRQIIRIIGTLPIARIKSQHITFMSTALHSRCGGTLAGQEIAQTILPKLIHNGEKNLTIKLLEVMFDTNVVNGQIVAVMEYWLKEAFKMHGKTLAKLCGVEVAEIALAQIRELIADGDRSFTRIQTIENSPSYTPSEDYAELLVNFTSMMFRLAPPDNITKIVENLLQESISENRGAYAQRQSRKIVGLIALNAIKHHYGSLKQLFWEWEGNPFNKSYLKPGLYQLIEANCGAFDEREIDRVLDWIESSQYYSDREEIVALRKREWLTALLETKNEKVISFYRKYEKMNPVEIEHPGLNLRIEIWAGSTSPLTVEELSAMSNARIAEYLANFNEPEIVIKKSDPTEEGLAKTLKKCVATNPQRFTDDLPAFQEVKNFYQNWMLHGFLEAWRDKKEFNWTALLRYFCQILLSEWFWTEQHNVSSDYRQWTLLTMADLIASGMVDDKRAIDTQLLPLAEQILLVLVEKVEPSDFSCINCLFDILSADRGKVFSAMINYALRFAFINDNTQGNCRWPQVIREDFTKRLNANIEPSLEFSYTLGAYLPDLSYLDKEWVVDNFPSIFPQQDELHWQAAFCGYLLHPQIYGDLYSLLKAHGHYQKALNTNFVDDEVAGALAEHICVGWVQGWETLDDDTSLIYQLIKSGDPKLLSAVVHFFLEQSDKLKEGDEPQKVKAYEKVKAKVRPTWRALFQVLSQNSDVDAYQQVLGPLSGWLELIDTIDAEVLGWVKESVKYIDKPDGYSVTLSRFFKALLKHTSETLGAVGNIYMDIPQRVIENLHTEKDDIKQTVRILYNNGQKDIAAEICNKFGKAEVYFLRDLYKQQH